MSSMKFDKEALIKHRFWIGLGVFVPLWLIIILVLWTAVGGTVSAAKKEYGDATGKAKNINASAPNDTFTTPAKIKEERLRAQKGRVWRAAWEPQALLWTWPGNKTAPLDEKMKTAYFGDPIEF